MGILNALRIAMFRLSINGNQTFDLTVGEEQTASDAPVYVPVIPYRSDVRAYLIFKLLKTCLVKPHCAEVDDETFSAMAALNDGLSQFLLFHGDHS